MRNCIAVLLMVCVVAMVGCGGGGGGGSTPALVATTATLKLSTQGTLSGGAAISGVTATVTLPTGVTVATNPDGSVASGVLAAGTAAIGGGSFVATYTPAAGATKATLGFTFGAAATGGIGVGEFTTVKVNAAPGITPVKADFTLSGVKVFDLLAAEITSGLTTDFVVTTP